MDKLTEIKEQVRTGRLQLGNINWLITTVENQDKTIKNLREKTRFSNYMKMAEENLRLAKRVEYLEVIEKTYRAYMSAK